jgi:methylated-DNA-[protein]-cysteine S-methyltransferase
MMAMRHTVMDSPVGEVTLVADGSALVRLYFAEHRRRPDPAECGERVDEGFEEAVGQLREYFAGSRTVFDLELTPRADVETGVGDPVRPDPLVRAAGAGAG